MTRLKVSQGSTKAVVEFGVKVGWIMDYLGSLVENVNPVGTVR